MKKLCGIGMIAEGLMLIFGPYYIWGTCGYNSEKVMVCRLSCNIEIMLGILIILFGTLFMRNKKQVLCGCGYISMNLLGVLVPSVLVGSCKMASMKCNVVTFPIVYIVCILSIIYGICIIYYCLSGKKKSEVK